MNQYHPPMKEIPAVIFTRSGWIRGVFHVPQLHGFLDYLARGGEFLKLTKVTLPYLKKDLNFFGLRREEASMIIPDCPEASLGLPHPVGNAKRIQIHFLLTNGCITGSLVLEGSLRPSDYLVKEHQWIVLHECVLGPNPNATTAPGAEAKFPMVLLNSGAILGASEESLAT